MKHGRNAAHIDHQLDLLGLGLVADQCDDVADDPLDFEVGEFELQLAGLDLRKVENVVDEVEQMVGGRADLGQPVGVPGVVDLATEQMGEPDDGVHRRADLVTHVGEEFAFAAAGRFGRLHGDDDFGVALGDELFEVVAMARQFFADPLLLGDVVLDGDVMGDVAVGLAQRSDAHRLDALLAGASTVDQLAPPVVAGGEIGPHGLIGFRGRFARLENARIAADDLTASVAALLHEGVVYVFDAARKVGHDDRSRCLLDDQRQLAQRPLCLLPRLGGAMKGEHRLGQAAQDAAGIPADGLHQRQRRRIDLAVSKGLQRRSDAVETPRHPENVQKPARDQRRHHQPADHRDADGVPLQELRLVFSPRRGAGGDRRRDGVGVLGQGDVAAGRLIGLTHGALRVDSGEVRRGNDQVAVGIEIGLDAPFHGARPGSRLQDRQVFGKPGKAVHHFGMHAIDIAFVEPAFAGLFERRGDTSLDRGDLLVETRRHPDPIHVVGLLDARCPLGLAQALQGAQVEQAGNRNDHRDRHKKYQLKAQQAGRGMRHGGVQRRSSGHWSGAMLATYSKPPAPLGRKTTIVASRGK